MSDFDSHSAWRTEGDAEDGEDGEGDAEQLVHARLPVPLLPINA